MMCDLLVDQRARMHEICTKMQNHRWLPFQMRIDPPIGSENLFGNKVIDERAL